MPDIEREGRLCVKLRLFQILAHLKYAQKTTCSIDMKRIFPHMRKNLFAILIFTLTEAIGKRF